MRGDKGISSDHSQKLTSRQQDSGLRGEPAAVCSVPLSRSHHMRSQCSHRLSACSWS